MDVQKLQNLISEKREQMVADMIEMSSIPAVNPKMGGTGEYARMQWIMRWFDKRQIPYEVYEVPDENVKEGVRLNVVVTIPGTKLTDRSLWFISHVDTVGPGDLSAWDTDPFTPTVKDGRIYGLGCEDNSQSVITTMYACEALFAEHIQIDRNLCFYYASDEETGSAFVEIAEKSQIWLKFTINGKTSHAAMPHLGINACYIGMKFGVELEDALKTRYDKEDTMFNPPMSTFEVTQKFANVESPNVMPGKDVFCMDLRILPDYSVDEVMEFIQGLMKQYEAKYPGINMNVEYLTRVVAPPPTSPESKVVRSLMEAISETGTKAYCGGIGGGTCGAILREKNIPAVIWSTLDDMCHTPNEYVVIDNLVRDTKIYLAALARYEE